MKLTHGRAALVACILMSLCGCGALCFTHSAKGDHGVVLTLRPVKEEFNLGEPVVIEARIHNANEQEVVLPDFNFWGYAWPT